MQSLNIHAWVAHKYTISLLLLSPALPFSQISEFEVIIVSVEHNLGYDYISVVYPGNLSSIYNTVLFCISNGVAWRTQTVQCNLLTGWGLPLPYGETDTCYIQLNITLLNCFK
jgi:hypothetical protein